ncbi:uncharacterized protein DNG_05836 [Cephalotrichum gorgonifer]|uniref:Xylanolytic transcriptional activator regulatory domain-containing protein n=1 Tax=Cephalotrichum gorgonifer TaxID=2041049 RepID=A0AAE8N0C8_9PEZI|nr:uncharacterized protein DNG_05836 [Cephalotrichum gorgonifer]
MELEEQLDKATSVGTDAPGAIPTPENSSFGGGSFAISSRQSPDKVAMTPRGTHWEGIHVATARSDQTSYYGPASGAYFVSRIGTYLASVLQRPAVPRSMQLRGACRALSSLASPEAGESTGAKSDEGPSVEMRGRFLRRPQEEYFISLFWESYHCTVPIIDEGAFRRDYASLWTSKDQRKASPLVDIILALCMQYGFGFLPRETVANENDGQFEDAQIAGRWYYRRCQSLLALEMESPTLVTVQCHIFSSLYLCCASFQNMAHSSLALAVRTAQILGLHLERPSMAEDERELRKRIWWALDAVETKVSMNLGRPSLALACHAEVSRPLHDAKSAALLGGILGTYAGVSWLMYSVEYQTLVSTASTIYLELYESFGSALRQKGVRSPYQDPEIMETCAKVLASRMELQEWVAAVPEGLKALRCSPASLPMSTDRTPMQIEYNAPLWLQRQRVFLELAYHSICMNLYRPFIMFSAPSSGNYSPFTERHSVAAAKHAITHTRIMHQMLSESDLLSGWMGSFRWQWNATVTLVGFVLAYPLGPSTQAARNAIDMAVEVFDIFKVNFAVAESASRLTTDLAAKVDLVMGKFRMGITESLGDGPSGEDAGSIQENQVSTGFRIVDSNGKVSPVGDSQYSSEFLESVLSFQAFNSFEDFYGDAFNFAGL